MSAATLAAFQQVARTLFPAEPPRRAARPVARRRSTLSQLFAVACALLPLGAVLHAWSLTTY